MSDKKADRIQVNVKVAGRNYPYVIHADDEQYLRESVKKIAETIQDLKSRYAFSDDQDVLANILLQQNTLWLKKNQEDGAGDIIKEIEFLDSQLDEYIRNNVE